MRSVSLFGWQWRVTLPSNIKVVSSGSTANTAIQEDQKVTKSHTHLHTCNMEKAKYYVTVYTYCYNASMGANAFWLTCMGTYSEND